MNKAENEMNNITQLNVLLMQLYLVCCDHYIKLTYVSKYMKPLDIYLFIKW